jgi:hypothetical protein
MRNNEAFKRREKFFKDLKRTWDEYTNDDEKGLKRDWDETKQAYVRRYRFQKRLDALNALVPHRKCVFCGEIYLRSRQWVLLDAAAVGKARRVLAQCHGRPEFADVQRMLHVLIAKRAICRACYRRYVEPLMNGDITL